MKNANPIMKRLALIKFELWLMELMKSFGFPLLCIERVRDLFVAHILRDSEKSGHDVLSPLVNNRLRKCLTDVQFLVQN